MRLQIYRVATRMRAPVGNTVNVLGQNYRPYCPPRCRGTVLCFWPSGKIENHHKPQPLGMPMYLVMLTAVIISGRPRLMSVDSRPVSWLAISRRLVIRAKRVSNCYIQKKKNVRVCVCSTNLGFSGGSVNRIRPKHGIPLPV